MASSQGDRKQTRRRPWAVKLLAAISRHQSTGCRDAQDRAICRIVSRSLGPGRAAAAGLRRAHGCVRCSASNERPGAQPPRASAWRAELAERAAICVVLNYGARHGLTKHRGRSLT